MGKYDKQINTPKSDELERGNPGDEKMVMFSGRLPESDLDYLKDAAKFSGKAQQEIMREALNMYRSVHPLHKLKEEYIKTL